MARDHPPEPDPRDDELVPEDDAIIGRALRISLFVLIAAALVTVVVVVLLRRSGGDAGRERPIEAEAPQAVERSSQPPAVSFRDVTAEAGIDFVHVNGATGERLLPETMGGGGAFFDYDADGDQDLLLVNSTRWTPSANETPPTMGLYENDGAGRFTDVTRRTGLGVSFYGTGVAVGDVDNDGFVDVFIAALGRNHLYRNRDDGEGGRRFQEVDAGIAGEGDAWSTSAAFFDADNDGDLDLFVCNYVKWSREIDLEVNYTLVGIGRAYGPPLNYRGSQPYFYRNRGDGTFDDVSAQSGVQVLNAATGEPVAKSLGVVPVDVEGDGLIDLFVANDTVRNFFFHNLGDGTFEERGELYGLAFGVDGGATGAMGVDVARYRDDDELAFAIGNFANEMTSLYVSQGDPTLYADEAIGEGVGAPSRRMLTFGLFFFDYDLDGRLDLLQANGHLEEEINTVDPSQEYRQPAQLFWNAGTPTGSTFVAVPPEATGDLAQPIVGRGTSYADIDGDGDLDVLLLQTGDRPLLLRNEQSLGHHWLRLELQGGGHSSNRDAIGAMVEIEAGGRRQWRQVNPTRSFQSQVELPVTFGLGASSEAEAVRIVWPDGSVQELGPVAADQLLVVEQESS